MKRIILFILFFVICVIGFSQDQIVFNTDFLVDPDTVIIFTPDDYDNNDNYPLYFLLHGWSGNYSYWHKLIDCQKYANQHNAIIVCPDGLYDSWYINSPVNKKSQFESFFFEELFPGIAKDYSVDESNIFITGLSMGGHGALYLFLKHPELFKSAGSMSGVLDLIQVTKGLGVEELLGIKDAKREDSIFNPFSVAANIEKIKESGKPIIFSCGVDDKYYKVNKEFRQLCDQFEIDATYIADPGDHNAAYWKKAIDYHFLFFKQTIKNQQ